MNKIQRVIVNKRENWIKRVNDIGFNFYNVDDEVYWNEGVAYQLTSDFVDEIDDATNLLYQMCMSAVDEVTASDDYMRKFAIPERFWTPIRNSWKRKDLDVYGRFDLTLDPKTNKLKMYEFNADTPTSLFEAGAVQWYWLEDYRKMIGKEVDQFNLIDERLVEAWTAVKENYAPNSYPFYFACCDNLEDISTVEYMMDTAYRAGINGRFILIDDIGWNGRTLTDLDENPINNLFKLYPWEWMVKEEIGNYLTQEIADIIEPSWKMVLSNKAITAMLWKMYPNHELLIPTYWDQNNLIGKNYVSKPLLSREGADITIHKDGNKESFGEGFYGKEGFIYQEYVPPLNMENNFPILGSWVIAGRAAGLGIREDDTEVTKNTSRFVPHFFI